MVKITDHLDIPEAELSFTTSRSSGPGGQNVNKVNTRVTLLWDVAGSPSISDLQRDKVRERLPGRINKEGIMQVSSQRHRTQQANREAAISRFAELIAGALSEDVRRVPTRVPSPLNQRRLEEKRLHGRIKRERSADYGPED